MARIMKTDLTTALTFRQEGADLAPAILQGADQAAETQRLGHLADSALLEAEVREQMALAKMTIEALIVKPVGLAVSAQFVKLALLATLAPVAGCLLTEVLVTPVLPVLLSGQPPTARPRLLEVLLVVESLLSLSQLERSLLAAQCVARRYWKRRVVAAL